MTNQMKSVKFILFMIILFLYSCNNTQRKEKTETITESKIKRSKIDSLNTDSEVENYIREINSNYKDFELKRIRDFDRDDKTDSITKLIAQKLKVTKAFYKSDFDNNGYTDLLVIGDNNDCWGGGKSCSFNSMVLMNFENDSIDFINIIIDRQTSIVPIIKKENGQTFLIINNPDQINLKNEKYKDGSIDTLIFKDGYFVEFNPNPVIHTIERIDYSTSPCHGECPIFQISINNKKEAIFNAEHYNFEKNRDKYIERGEGIFKSVISNQKYREITELINYLDFENLKNDYGAGWMGRQRCTLEIVYDGGKVKTINDNGLIGTFGLKKLYEFLFDLRLNQEWKKTNITDKVNN